MTEKQEAFDLANRILENPSLDPDGDASVIARQFLRAREEIDAMREALERADSFITNGIELGFIRMPDASTPDPAHETPGLIRAVLANFTVPQVDAAKAVDARRKQ